MAMTQPLRQAQERPNILFIAIDDLKPMLGCYGDANILSPHIDKLAERGTVFLNNACQQAVCAPSRASLMTGTYPDTTKVWDLKTQMREANPDTLTLPEYLQQYGYETTGVGKTYDPRSVDDDYDNPSWSQPYYHIPPPEYFADSIDPEGGYHAPEVAAAKVALQDYLKKEGIKKSDKKAFKAALQKFPMVKPVSECMDLPDDAYKDGASANYALEKMEQLAKGGKPFFLSVGFSKPHLPFVAPKKYWDLYDRSKIELAPFQKMPEGTPEFAFQDSWELRNYTGVPPKGPIPEELQLELIHGYRASTSYADAQVGKVLDKLEELGLADDTIVVLWGDHGFHLGDHGMFCKHSNFEQAVRSPLVISVGRGAWSREIGAGSLERGTKTESPSEFVDIFSTLCELIGVPVPESVEGLSLLPILEDPDAMVHEAALEQYPRWPNKMGYTLRDKRYRYVKWIEIEYKDGERSGPVVGRELYDYEKDPLETVNQVDNPEYKDVVANFERIFKKRGIAQEK
jgi:arylsulfatase A-like enzyme